MAARKNRALAVSTMAFTVCFAVWTIFSIIGIQIKQDLGLNETEFGLLVAMPVLPVDHLPLVSLMYLDGMRKKNRALH